jgi:hypothetical protein
MEYFEAMSGEEIVSAVKTPEGFYHAIHSITSHAYFTGCFDQSNPHPPTIMVMMDDASLAIVSLDGIDFRVLGTDMMGQMHAKTLEYEGEGRKPIMAALVFEAFKKQVASLLDVPNGSLEGGPEAKDAVMIDILTAEGLRAVIACDIDWETKTLEKVPFDKQVTRLGTFDARHPPTFH